MGIFSWKTNAELNQVKNLTINFDNCRDCVQNPKDTDFHSVSNGVQ